MPIISVTKLLTLLHYLSPTFMSASPRIISCLAQQAPKCASHQERQLSQLFQLRTHCLQWYISDSAEPMQQHGSDVLSLLLPIRIKSQWNSLRCVYCMIQHTSSEGASFSNWAIEPILIQTSLGCSHSSFLVTKLTD